MKYKLQYYKIQRTLLNFGVHCRALQFSSVCILAFRRPLYQNAVILQYWTVQFYNYVTSSTTSPITVAAESKAWNVSASAKNEVLGLNPTGSMDAVCLYFLFVFFLRWANHSSKEIYRNPQSFRFSPRFTWIASDRGTPPPASSRRCLMFMRNLRCRRTWMSRSRPSFNLFLCFIGLFTGFLCRSTSLRSSERVVVHVLN
jgi:hypothetical protein